MSYKERIKILEEELKRKDRIIKELEEERKLLIKNALEQASKKTRLEKMIKKLEEENKKLKEILKKETKNLKNDC